MDGWNHIQNQPHHHTCKCHDRSFSNKCKAGELKANERVAAGREGER